MGRMVLDVAPYDAVLLVSFGGPEGPDDVLPFLENVTRGRDIPRERLEEVGEHYHLFGGRSPINDQNRELLAAVREDLSGAGIDLPVYWGNRNWAALPHRRGPADGRRRHHPGGLLRHQRLLVVLQLPAVPRGPRRGRGRPSPDAPRLDRLRQYFNHPGFVEPVVDATLAALAELPESVRDGAHLTFVTHSIPESMNEGSGRQGNAYVNQHRSVVAAVVDRVRQETGRRNPHELVYCSRSGPPHVPWLEPDVNDHLEALSRKEAPGVVLVPIGFVSDHMEVVYDLDTEALTTAAKLDLPAVRAATPGIDPRFVAVVRDLLVERAATERGEKPRRRAVGSLQAWWDLCGVGCCPNPLGDRPAVGGVEA